MSKARTLLAVGIGVVLMSVNTAQASMTYFQLCKCLNGCCAIPPSPAKNSCIANCWAAYRAKTGAVAGGEPSLEATTVSISNASEGYRRVSQESSVAYNNMVYPPNQEVTVIAQRNTTDTVTSMRLILLETGGNPNSGFCSNGNNTAGPFCNEDADCTGGNTCTGIRRTCQGGASPGTPCATDGNCSGGNTCERTLGVQVDQCSVTSVGPAGCTGAGTPLACCTGSGTGTCIGWWTCSWTPTIEHFGALIVEPEIAGHDLDNDSDSALVVTGTKIWGVPAVSEWGMVLLTLLVLSGATVVLLRARSRLA